MTSRTVCYNFQLVRDKPVGAPPFLDSSIIATYYKCRQRDCSWREWSLTRKMITSSGRVIFIMRLPIVVRLYFYIVMCVIFRFERAMDTFMKNECAEYLIQRKVNIQETEMIIPNWDKYTWTYSLEYVNMIANRDSFPPYQAQKQYFVLNCISRWAEYWLTSSGQCYY